VETYKAETNDEGLKLHLDLLQEKRDRAQITMSAYQERVVLHKFNCTRQLHESIVIEWMCKCECRTHRKSCLSKTNLNA
jgi:hypothetical protein